MHACTVEHARKEMNSRYLATRSTNVGGRTALMCKEKERRIAHPCYETRPQTRDREMQENQAYSIRRAGASNFNSAKLVFLSRGDPALTSSCPIPASFVHIHVDAYIFTLYRNVSKTIPIPIFFRPHQGNQNLPINTTTRHPNRHPLSPKTILSKHLDIPRLQPRTPQHHPPLDL
jgi:hypothetical protein